MQPSLAGRAGVAAMGLFVLFLATSRARGFWDAPGAEVWRKVFGDRVVLFIFVAVGLGCIALAVFAPL